MGFFLGLRHCANPLGELTRPTAVGGEPIEVRTSQSGLECQPTHLTRRAPPGDHPGGDRLTRWQMSLLPLQQQPHRGLHKDRHRPMTAESRLPSMHITQWTAGQTGGRHEAQLRGKDANSSQSISNGQLSGCYATATEWICKTDTEDDVNATHADTQTRQYERIK